MFLLEKWYFDCISEHGDAFIGYAAKVKAGWINLNYGAYILIDPKVKENFQKQSFSFGNIIQVGNQLEWSNKHLNLKGVWDNSESLSKTRLCESGKGYIDWQVFKLASKTNIEVNKKHITGSGYVEYLRMTIPPWKLTFKELRWGRFVSVDPKESVVWINWRGGENERNTVWNKNKVYEAKIEDNNLYFGGSTLRLDHFRQVRIGELKNTLLGKFRFLSFILPKGIRNIFEEKWLSRGLLITKGEKDKFGWSINEIVKF